ncbi:MAG TPA: glycosyltransferase [Phycisphaerae bacterium]|nr:glycosyltransferase [Phycisphaerae bacterium]
MRPPLAGVSTIAGRKADTMRVFMLGWEFPPHISGGLGTACYGMTKGLNELGVEVCFVLPTPVPLDSAAHVSFRTPADLKPSPASPPGASTARGQDDSSEEVVKLFEHVELHRLEAYLQAYGTVATRQSIVDEIRRLQACGELSAEQVTEALSTLGGQPALADDDDNFFDSQAQALYGRDLMFQVRRYERLAAQLAIHEEFDIVHAHDWMTFPAGLAVAKATGKPLVVHVHSTEFDRAGANVNQDVYDIERAGMQGADRIVCVSHLTGTICKRRYGVRPEKISVVYNAVEGPNDDKLQMRPITTKEKIVLFLGRVTMQKGPEYFLRAAKKVVGKFKNVRFVIAGSGDMITQCVKEVADLRLGRYVTFTGFLRSSDVSRVFGMADLYVMPSVSEPFGIAPLEALSHNVPVIISKQSGVSEILQHVLKVDFWDVDEMANKILAVLRHPPLQRTLRQHGQIEVSKLSWRDSAAELRDIYTALTADA